MSGDYLISPDGTCQEGPAMSMPGRAVTPASTGEMSMAFEIPLYRFRKGVSFEDAKRTALGLNDFLRNAPGFKARSTYYDDKNDIWIDVVEWETMELALQALDDFSKSPSFAEIAKLADPNFNHMYHGNLIQTLTA
jgi:hypothetical protein